METVEAYCRCVSLSFTSIVFESDPSFWERGRYIISMSIPSSMSKVTSTFSPTCMSLSLCLYLCHLQICLSLYIY